MLNIKKYTQKVILFGVLFTAFRTLVGSFSNVYPLVNGLSVVEIGYIKSFQFALILLLDVPISYMSDRRGYAFSLKMSAGAALLSFGILSLSSSFPGFVAAEFFNAISLLLFSGAYTALLHNQAQNEQLDFDTVNGRYNYLCHNAMLLCSALGGVLLMLFQHFNTFDETYNYRVIYILSTALFIFLYIFSFRLLALTDNNNELSIKDTSESVLAILKNSFQQLSRLSRVTKADLLGYISVTILFGTAAQIWQPIIFHAGDDSAQAYVLLAFFAIVMAAQSLAGKIYPNISKWSRRALGSSFIMIGLIVMLQCAVMWVPQTWEIYLGLQFLSIGILFFLIRCNLIYFEGLLLSVCSPQYKASFMSTLATVARLFLIFWIPFVFWLIEVGNTAIILLVSVHLAVHIIRYWALAVARH